MGSDFEGQLNLNLNNNNNTNTNLSSSTRSSSYSSSSSDLYTQQQQQHLSKMTQQELTQTQMQVNFLLQQMSLKNNNMNSSEAFSDMNNYHNLEQLLLAQNALSGSSAALGSFSPRQIPNSGSQIFATAASFNISQNDTIMFARETIHLLAKFLANHSEITLFRSLYAYAPDNLAWLWAFIDWDTQVDFKKQVATQETYEPFKWCMPQFTASYLSNENENVLNYANKIFADSPLVQYRYREKVMIGDLCKFIEHVHKIEQPNIAKALFLLYFPRFSNYIDNPLKKFLNPKILSSNLCQVQELDTMIVKLIRTRYNDLKEYRQKILTRQNLPSYVDSLLDSECFSSSSNNQKNKNLFMALINDQQFQRKLTDIKELGMNNNSPQKTQMASIATSTPAIHSNSLLNTFLQQNNNQNKMPDNKTLMYMNMIQQSQLNSDLDHNNDYDLNQEIHDLQLEFEAQQQQQQQSSNDLIMNAAATAAALLNNEQHGITNNNKSPLMIMSDQDEEELKQLYLNELLMNNLNLNAQVYSPVNSQASSSSSSNQVHHHHNSYPLSAIGSPRPNSTTTINTQTTIDINNNNQLLSPVSHYALAGGLSQLNMTPKTPSHAHHHQLQELLWSTNQKAATMTPPPSANQAKNVLFTSLNQNTNEQQNESLFIKEFNLNPLANSFQHSHQIHSPRGAHNQTYTAGEFNFNSNVFNHNKLNENSSMLVNGFNRSAKNNNNNHHQNFNFNSFHNNNDSKSWSGRLPPKIYSTQSIYSRKVFLGGLPWDVNQQYLLQLLHQYGQVKLEIPGKDQKHPRVSTKTQERNTPGYVYIIFENESSVQRLLGHCRKELKNGGEHFYYNIAIPTFSTATTPQQQQSFPYGKQSQQQRQVTGIKTKEVEVIPWNQDDTSYVPQSDSIVLPSKIDSKCTIFVGALHGMLNAQGLAKVMSEVFGEAIHAGLDTDKYKYPIGSGRVTFRNRASYVKAIKAKYVTISANQSSNDPSPKFEKTIQIDPYLEDAKCCMCQAKSVYFCRNEFCLDYYCQGCWQVNHDRSRGGEHQGMCRQNKTTHNF